MDAAAGHLRRYYEGCLARHGANHLGVDWPKPADPAGAVLLDVGCGPGLFLDHLGALPVVYRGIDISPAMVEAARQRHPGADFEARDLITDPLPQACVDYAVLNGVFTVRGEVDEAAMFDFARALLRSVFASCRQGLAVNFMAPHADWRDDKLFYLSLDQALAFFKAELARHVVLRLDYGLWEYTAYIYRTPRTATLS